MNDELELMRAVLGSDAHTEQLTERAEAALDGYFADRIENDDPPEPTSSDAHTEQKGAGDA